MRRIRSFAAMSCLLQGNSSVPIAFAGTPSLAPRYSALSVFAPELDASFGSDAWTVFSSARELHSVPVARHRRPFRGPPPNAVYELEAQIPVIGRQVFQLKILNDGVASLAIEGLLELRDVIRYEVDGGGEFAFDLSDATKMILKRFRTKLVKVRYCSETDTPSVIVRPPLPTNIKLTLRRKALPIAL